jgi:DNA-3-methyladenine glycosylase
VQHYVVSSEERREDAVLDFLIDTPGDVAPCLIGSLLTTIIDGAVTSVRLTEVEAYGGADDPASHAYRGRTVRNRSMFLPAGHLYVYRSYGIHDLVNIVTGPEGEPGAVLLRAGDPIEGRAVMERRRRRRDHLTDGPGKLAQALGLTMNHDGIRLNDGPVAMTPRTTTLKILATPRIGITRAVERPWRFVPATTDAVR